MSNRHLRGALAILFAVGTATPRPAAEQSVEQFYKGRQMTMVVGTSPGGINDISARFVAQASRPLHPRQSDLRRPEHAGRRRHRLGQPPL